ncbi:MAG: hypothetical protein NC307_12535 [Roseburia sp.]|nr:hypothetical protein [Roseburia sp.]
MIKQRYKVIGFVDKRAKDIGKCLGLPVYELEELKEHVKEDAVIFVAVKNVYYHEDIVETLNSLGFFYVIYKSEKAIAGEMGDREKALDAAYEGIYKKGNVLPLQIPVIMAQKKINWKEDVLLKEDVGEVVVKIPVELLHTGVTDATWMNVPVLLLIPYIDLFRYFQGQEQYSPNDYIELCQKGANNENLKITKSWKEYVLLNRRDIFEQMYLKYEFEPDYFLDSAPKAKWNDKGYFTIETGKHRVCFLISMGVMNIPVRISKVSWAEYVDGNRIDRLKNILMKHTDLKIPIPHPFFQGTAQYNSFRQQMILQRILRILYKEKLLIGSDRKIDTVIDGTDTAGYFARFFSSMGMKAYTGKKQLCCMDELNHLFQGELSEYENCNTREAVVIAEESAGVKWIECLNLEKYYYFQIDNVSEVHYREN